MQRAKEDARYTLDNGQLPENPKYVPEPMEAELLDVFDMISTLVSLFFKVASHASTLETNLLQ